MLLSVCGAAEADVPQSLERPVHIEQPNDPPVWPAAEGPQLSTTPGMQVSVGSIRSVQVNVNAAGMNIVGDAANEPSMAVHPFNRDQIAIGWRQFDTITNDFRKGGFGFSRDGGETWSFGDVLEDVIFASDPVLSYDLDGNFYYFSLQPTRGPGPWSCYMYKSSDGGQSWPQEEYALGGDKQWMAVDRTEGIGRGHVYTVWSPFVNCCGNRTFSRSTDCGVTFDEPVGVPFEPFFGTLTVDPDGRVFVTGAVDFGGGFIVTRSSNAQDSDAVVEFDQTRFVNLGGIQPRGFGPNPGGLLGQVWIAADHSNTDMRGNIYVLSSITPFVGGDPADVMFIRSEDGGETWSEPVRVNDDPQGNDAYQWFGTMSVAPNGRIDVFWNDTRRDPTVTFSEVYYASSHDGGRTWSNNVVASPPYNHFLGYPMQNKIGDYWHSRSDDRGAGLAYAATFNGEQDVYYMRVNQAIGDGDLDGDTDLADFATFSDCMSVFDPVCELFDVDLDADVDLLDFGGFQDGFTGECGIEIVSQPVDIEVCTGETVSFSVVAEGNVVSYRWHRNGVVIPGATEPTLMLSNVTLDDAGFYQAVVTSECAQAVSDAAVLDVPSAPVIVEQPMGGSVCAGDAALLAVEAIGVEPLSYQWSRDGTPIDGATEAELFIDEVVDDAFGTYACVVTDGCGQATASSVAELGRRDVTITTNPVGGAVCEGGNFILFVSASNATEFQWRKDDIDLPGATSFFYSDGEATLDDAGAYTVVVSNECNAVVSEPAVMVVDVCP